MKLIPIRENCKYKDTIYTNIQVYYLQSYLAARTEFKNIRMINTLLIIEDTHRL